MAKLKGLATAQTRTRVVLFHQVAANSYNRQIHALCQSSMMSSPLDPSHSSCLSNHIFKTLYSLFSPQCELSMKSLGLSRKFHNHFLWAVMTISNMSLKLIKSPWKKKKHKRLRSATKKTRYLFLIMCCILFLVDQRAVLSQFLQGLSKECHACHENNVSWALPGTHSLQFLSLALPVKEAVRCVNKCSPPPLMNSPDLRPRRRRISTCLSQNMIQAHGCLTGIKGHTGKIWLWK